MIVHDITNKLILKDKSDLEGLFKSYEKVRGLICKGVTCVDLTDLPGLKTLYEIEKQRYLLIYHFHNLDTLQRDHIATPLLAGETTCSFAQLWPSLYYGENEVSQNFGIKFYRKERIQDEFIEKGSPSFLDKDSGSCILKPISPLPKAEFDETNFKLADYDILKSRAEFLLAHDGNRMNHLKVHSSASYLGIEKIVENIKLNSVGKYLNHVNSNSWVLYQILWVETLDCLNDHKSTHYEVAKRMLFVELSRVYENLISLMNSFKLLDELDAHDSCQAMANKILKHLLAVDSQRPYPTLVQAGQQRLLPSDWKRVCAEIVNESSLDFTKLKSSITRLSRVVGIAHNKVSPINALKSGHTGLALRSYGVSYDIRKNDPFYLYEELDLNVSLGIAGSSYDRIIIRMDEVDESLSNLIRLIESFPIPNTDDSEEDKSTVLVNGAQDRILYSYTETTSGELAYLCVFKGDSDQLYRLNIMGPTTRSLKVFEESYDVAEVDTILLDWVSLGLNMDEVLK